jgi:hypothetical protein
VWVPKGSIQAQKDDDAQVSGAMKAKEKKRFIAKLEVCTKS